MRRYFNNITTLALIVFLASYATNIVAQPKVGNQKKSAVKTIEINSKVVSQAGNPIVNAAIITAEGAIIRYSDKTGAFSIKAAMSGVVLIEAAGYEDVKIDLIDTKFPKVITLTPIDPVFDVSRNISRLDGHPTTMGKNVGSSAKIKGADLKTYPDLVTTNALQGRLAGLQVRNNAGGLGNNTPSIFVRGQHTIGDNQAVVVIDGIERNLSDISAEEIESIEVFKDATSKILYGSRGANGVVYVTTRRGEANKRTFNVSAELGVMNATRLPQYLGSYDYAVLYNEARANDGMAARYLDYELEGYKNSTGANDMYYPDVDYINTFLKKQSMFRKVTLDLNGGNDKIQYSMITAYNGADGLEKIGQTPGLNRFNVRGNLNVKVTDYLNLTADVGACMEMRSFSSIDGGTYLGRLGKDRPNEYPLVLDATIMDEKFGIPIDEKAPHFGGSFYQPNNLYADAMYGGFTKERYINSQNNFGVDLDLKGITKGLSMNGYITFDNYSYFKQGQSNTFPTYALTTINDNVDGLQTSITQLRKRSLQSDQSRKLSDTYRNMGYSGNISYENIFGKHAVNAVASAIYRKNEIVGEKQDLVNTTFTGRLNYMFDKRYSIEADIAGMGSNRFVGNRRYFTSYAFGGAWIISNEDFMKAIKSIDYLKLKASYGMLGYDRGTDHLLYATSWQNGTTFPLGEANIAAVPITQFIRIGNPNLKWEYSKEYNIGVEAVLMGHRLNFTLDYFNEKRENIIGKETSKHAGYVGPYVKSYNVGATSNHGIDAYINWSDKIGDFSYSIGANVLWTKSKIRRNDELDNIEGYRKQVGKPIDAIFGYQAIGLFGRDVDIAGHPFQTLGYTTNGDIAYANLNDDEIIDERDVALIGGSFPDVTFGIDLRMQYKQWGLYVLGTAETGLSVLANNTYYQSPGESKYSVTAAERYHPTNNPKGQYPRLSTTESKNNYSKSTFWLEKGDFFRLKNIELSYTLSFYNPKAVVKEVKIFTRATNLFVISGIKDLDPELLNAGVNNYPVLRNFTAGVSLNF